MLREAAQRRNLKKRVRLLKEVKKEISNKGNMSLTPLAAPLRTVSSSVIPCYGNPNFVCISSSLMNHLRLE